MSIMSGKDRCVASNCGACPLTLSSLPQAGLGGERNSRSRALRARPQYFIEAEVRA